MPTRECFTVSPECPVKATVYGYYPSLGGNAFFAALFFALIVPNVFFGIKYRTWTYLIAVGFACLGEGIGYIGRILLHNNPWDNIGFEIQICCLIISPAFNSAAIYLTLKHIALTFGPEYSLVKPRLYTYIFIAGDLLSLILQGAGGGIAATADNDDPDMQDLGTDIMLAGIVWQVITLMIFAATAGLYINRRRKATRNGAALTGAAKSTWENTRFKLFMWAIVTSYFAVLIRCIYRIVEMAGGWGNEVMRDEPSYIVLEGVLIAYTCLVQTVFHPGYCFPQMSSKYQYQTSYAGKSSSDFAGSLEMQDESGTEQQERK